MSRDISVDDLLSPPDEVLLDAHDAELDIQYALENENNVQRRAQLLTYDLLTNDDVSVKLARCLCVKEDILNKGYDKMSRNKPRVNCNIDVNLADLSLHNRFEPLTRLLSDMHGDCADSDSEFEDDTSDTTSSSEQSPRRRRRRNRNRTRPPEVPPQPPEPERASMASQHKRRANYAHARRRIRDRISKMSDIDVALYLFSHNLRDGESDFFADVKEYLTKDIEYFNCNPANADQWLARCLFNNESCEVTLETFVQLQYNEIHHPT